MAAGFLMRGVSTDGSDYLPTTYVFIRLPTIVARILDLFGGSPKRTLLPIAYLNSLPESSKLLRILKVV